MPDPVAYTCINITCDGYGEQWPVLCDQQGAPDDEAEARCPDCYGPGVPLAPAHAHI